MPIHTRPDEDLRLCSFAGCVDEKHRWLRGEFNDAHQIDQIEGPDGMYTIYGFNHEDGDGWKPSVSVSDAFEDNVTMEIAHKFTRDYAVVQARCSVLNAGASPEAKTNSAETCIPRTVEVRPCSVFGCTDGEHTYVNNVMDDECQSIKIGDGTEHNARFFVSGYRDEATGQWSAFANVDLDEIAGTEGLVLTEQLALAYRTVQQHCDALNARERG